jgi:hypothetical protein
LHAQVIHGVNNGGLLHWQPASGYRSSPDYFTIPPSSTSFNLWVQAPKVPADSPNNIALWLKGNVGLFPATGNVTSWADQVGVNTFSVIASV